jgi:hypothetical protein
MVVNFRARGISRGARKLVRTPMLMKKIMIRDRLAMIRCCCINPGGHVGGHVLKK